ncbi:SDR family NAD(P)-dependent oxidoreductase [Sphingomonas sp.]|uniref:SDR family NAD(P)-dependent oxidoreductase n=1 Tax=Sphingomonas sp. TaxID=28214 RepID=UPI003F6FCCC6
MADATRGRLAGRTAIVTGGGRGIGEAIVKRFAEEGARLLVATRTAGYGQETVDAARAAGGEAHLIVAELGTRNAASKIVDYAKRLWGGLDILVHNAAYAPHGKLPDTADSEWSKAMDVGPNTAFWLMKDAFPLLRASEAGRVILTSSIMADRNSIPGLSAYTAAKGAINSLVRGAAVDFGPEGITVNAVAPGGTMSVSFAAGMSADYIAEWEKTIPLRRVGQGSDIANAMLFLASDDGGYVTGQTLIVDGGQALGIPLKIGH